MDAASALGATFTTCNMVLSAYISDFSDSELLNRPGPGCQHMAWQLGHLIVAERDLLAGVCPGKEPSLPEGFAEKYTKDTAGEDDPRQFHTKDEYVALLEASEKAVRAALGSLSAEDLDAPSPEHFRNMFPTVGNIFVLIATHRLMHAGQWVPIRRALGKPVVI